MNQQKERCEVLGKTYRAGPGKKNNQEQTNSGVGGNVYLLRYLPSPARNFLN